MSTPDVDRLTFEQERSLLAAFRNNKPESKKAGTRLYNQFRSLALKQVHEKCFRLDLFDDMCQEGYLALIEAMYSFDIARGTRLSTYLTHVVHGRLSDFLKKEALFYQPPIPKYIEIPEVDEAEEAEGIEIPERLYQLSLDSPKVLKYDSDGSPVTLVDTLVDEGVGSFPDKACQRSQAAERIKLATQSLPDRQREAVTGSFLFEKSQRQVASEMDICPSRVTRLISAALVNLHDELFDLAA